MYEILIWLYIINSTFLIVHEIDSAYWKEWELFKLPYGVNGFLIVHIPLIIIVLYGIILINNHNIWGIIISIFTSIGGIGALLIHSIFIRKGRKEFTTVISQIILKFTFSLSLALLIMSIYVAINN